MRQRLAASVGATTLVFGAMIGAAAPASADRTWEMPGPLRGSTLAQAQAALQPLLDGGVIRLNAYNRNGAAQEILNATNWIVCSQSPRAGAVYKVNLEKKRTVSLSLRRPETKC